MEDSRDLAESSSERLTTESFLGTPESGGATAPITAGPPGGGVEAKATLCWAPPDRPTPEGPGTLGWRGCGGPMEVLEVRVEGGGLGAAEAAGGVPSWGSES